MLNANMQQLEYMCLHFLLDYHSGI